jgi:hypothetical protein
MATVRGGFISDQVSIRPSGDGFSYLDENLAIPSGATANVLTLTVPALSTFYLKGVQGSGGACAIFFLKVDAAEIKRYRTSYMDRNCGMRFDPVNGYKIDGGSIIEIETKNEGESTNGFWAELYGEMT